VVRNETFPPCFRVRNCARRPEVFLRDATRSIEIPSENREPARREREGQRFHTELGAVAISSGA
jgi:hypothetical protein